MKNNILITILAIGALAAAGFWYFNFFSSGQAEVVEKVLSANELSGEPRELLNALAKMQKIKINTAFFENPLYLGLIDLSPTIEIPEMKGRKNPFLPIGD
ncbi:MAG: hypothetical protein HYW71_00900 [Candidatus Niyogibacteria bacterium]|nr:hypothetical protein [Candidatus Niyogibacteria bacterium]